MTVDQHSGAAATRRLLLVVGVGRSGTSLLTSIFGQLGFHVPHPEVQADESNPRGFGEPRWVVDFHTRLMRQRRVTVFDSRPGAWESTADAVNDVDAFGDLRSWLGVQFVGADNVVVKDPRVGWFLPLWLRAASELEVQPSCVTMLRHPLEIVSSARKWYGTWQNDASRGAAWLNIMLHTEQATRAVPRAFIRYENLLEDWSREVSRVAQPLDFHRLAAVERSRYPAVDALVDPGLRRSRQGQDDVSLPPVLQEKIEEVWAQVYELANSGSETESALSSLDEARASYTRFYADVEAIAQSSVTAAKPRPKSEAQPAPVAPAAAPSEAHASFALRAVRRIPPGFRHRVPLGIRRAALRVGRQVRSLRLTE
jgi:hypothetical protein